MNVRRATEAIFCLWAGLCFCASVPAAAEVRAQSDPAALIQPGDRILFVGDEITQQMFFTRAVAAALMPLNQDKNLRFFNGGWDGATADDATDWVDELMGLVQPTVVFVCFGFNEAQNGGDPTEVVTAYLRSMNALLDRIGQHPQVREMIVIGPPPVQAGLTQKLVRGETNHTLLVLSNVAGQAARSRGARFIDLYEHLSAVYLGQMSIGGSPLTVGGRLPTEAAHMVIASVVLRELGVNAAQLELIGWSPLPPVKMQRIRQVLATPMRTPPVQAAEMSRSLYVSLLRFDEAFFRMWRLSRRRTPGGGVDLRTEAERAWSEAAQESRRMAGVGG